MQEIQSAANNHTDTLAGPAETLRVGVAGAGIMGCNHARVIAAIPGVELVGIADPDPDRRQFAQQVLDCETFPDVGALLKRKIAAVVVATPTATHLEVAITCIEQGIHVLVEKPIASSVEEARRIISAARKANVTLMVGHIERFNPAVEALKQAVLSNQILSIAITRVGPIPPRAPEVGIVTDLAVHDIDLILWLTQSKIVEIQSQLCSAVSQNEDLALLQFRTASGVLAHVNTNWVTPFKARTVTVATRDKFLIADLLSQQTTEYFGFHPDGSYSMRHLSVSHTEPLRAEIKAFTDAIFQSKRPPVSGEDGLASLEVAMSCLEGRDRVERGTPLIGSSKRVEMDEVELKRAFVKRLKE
jgi:UDP-N-acetylglucosamine 3-dehydrogenase